MNSKSLQTTLLATVVGSAHAAAAPASADATVAELVARIRSHDDNTRGDAWQGAGRFGAPAVKPLAAILNDSDFETVRAAQRALWRIVHFAGRPGAQKEASAVERELVDVLAQATGAPSRREVAWMLSEIGGDLSVPGVSALLDDPALQQDACGVLERLPGKKSLAALQHAWQHGPEQLKPVVADCLRKRGVAVSGYPTQRLVPVKQTRVKPAS